jgi:hypothetical protein
MKFSLLQALLVNSRAARVTKETNLLGNFYLYAIKHFYFSFHRTSLLVFIESVHNFLLVEGPLINLFRVWHYEVVASALVEYTLESHLAQLNRLMDPSMPPHIALDTHFHHSSQELN